jgi:hypothetical protein
LSLRTAAEFMYIYLGHTSSPMMILNALACLMQKNEEKKFAGSHSSLLTLASVGIISSKLQVKFDI